MPIPVDTTGYYNKSVDLMKQYGNLNFVQRALNPKLQKMTLPDPHNKGGYMSHRMSYVESNGQYYAYPEVVQIGNKLHYMPGRQAMDYAFKNKQAIPLGNDRDFADYFTTVGYKYKMNPDVYSDAMNDYSNNTNIMKLIPKNKKGGSSKNWIQGAVNPKHKGYCTPMTKSTCTPRRKALAKRFKAMAKHDQGGLLLPNIQAQIDELKNNQDIQLSQLQTPQVEIKKSEPITQPTNLSFGDAFKQARKDGLDVFTWNGKSFTTQLKSQNTQKPANRVAQAVAAKATQTATTSGNPTVLPNITITANRIPPKEDMGGIKVLPNVSVVAKAPTHITTIEQARNILRGKNVMPSASSTSLQSQISANKNANPAHSGYLSRIFSSKYKQGGKLSKEYIKKAHEKPGGSNVGEKKFANGKKRVGPYVGPSGGAPKGSYPIPDKNHARAALSLAHNAPNPSGIKAAVYRKYPELKKK